MPGSPEGAERQTPDRDRKAEHLDLALDPWVQVGAGAFDEYRLEHCALPEIDADEIDTRCDFLGRALELPLLISCMTGGTEEAEAINRHLAEAAQQARIALGVGSQRKALEDAGQRATFAVRRYAPDVPVLANLGAVQLNYGYGPDECRQAVEMVEADALVLHLNPLQEAIQPEGDLRFGRLLPRIAEVVEALDREAIPVVVKEVGNGLSRRVGEALAAVGVKVLDTAGAGGTSWARIEASRAGDLPLGELFGSWGIPTPESILQLRDLPGVEVIGSGGLRHGLDVAKALALGARLGAMAYRFVAPARAGTEAVVAKIEQTGGELRIAMLCTGSRDLPALARVPWTRVRTAAT
ncbi:MAG: type 2 isopentenyl-diphosphate Delta-isomerase [Acidobacteria bacterium]|nr:MAG: type 2 isopentenyl-diphosphate Delta-isomerase [Acidobacteriota bacterium]REK12216.1 MAG: type 2 isopentenyl-diphosphate Delta-isomerase [Acidobacteriota bacterium]